MALVEILWLATVAHNLVAKVLNVIDLMIEMEIKKRRRLIRKMKVLRKSKRRRKRLEMLVELQRKS